jgi:hypothetical protein
MRDLLIKDNDLVVATHGRSFWILDDVTPLRQIAEMKADGAAFLFKPAPAFRVRRSTYPDTPLPPDEPAGENPPDGAVIDYALPEGFAGTVSLEILDAGGKVVRKYTSSDAPESTIEELSKQLIPLYWLRMPKTLPGTPGTHRWVWDLRYTTPTATNYSYPISAVPHDTPPTPQGPLALPGTYTVRLTAAGKTLTAPLSVKIDPRVHATPADLQTLFAAQVKLAALVTKSASASLEVHSVREQIDSLSKTAPPAIKESIETLDKSLAGILSGRAKPTGGEAEPGLDDVAGESAALYEQVGSADAGPTAAQLKAGERAAEEVQEAVERWDKLKATSFPALNRELQGAHLPVLNLDQKPQNMPDSGDED